MGKKIKLQYLRMYVCEIDSDKIIDAAKKMMSKYGHELANVQELLRWLDITGQLRSEEPHTEEYPVEGHAHVGDDWFEYGDFNAPWGTKNEYQIDELKKILED